jgi:DNA-binding response OmpR family regulator
MHSDAVQNLSFVQLFVRNRRAHWRTGAIEIEETMWEVNSEPDSDIVGVAIRRLRFRRERR